MVSAPRCLPGARGLLALLLLLSLPGARGECGALPSLNHAVPRDTAQHKSYPIDTKVTYKCSGGCIKIPGKSDTVVCLSNSQWSTIGECCGPSCGAPPRLKSAALSKEEQNKNYHPIGSSLSYVCRPGYEGTRLSPVITCLENLTWSEAPEFCTGKSCGVPEGPEHGRAVKITNYLYGAKVNINCDEGFRSRGRKFIQCNLKGDEVEWSPLPTCEAIICSPPPDITNGMHNGSNVERFDCNSSVTYKCDDNFLLSGEASIQCTTKDNINGVWNGSAPECKAITCSPPPDITNGRHNGSNMERFDCNSSVTYSCDGNFSLTGEASIHCTTKDKISGVWNGSAPECKASCGNKTRHRRSVHPDINGREDFPTDGQGTEKCLDGSDKIPGSGTDRRISISTGHIIGISTGSIGVISAPVILFKWFQKKKSLYSVNRDSAKHQRTTEHDFQLKETESESMLEV